MADFVTLLHHAFLHEAEQLKGLLGDAGVVAFVDRGEAAGFSSIGANCDVRLMVIREQESLAREVLQAAEIYANADHGPDWHCGPCDELVEGGFDVCWSCGRDRGEVADPTGPRVPTPQAIEVARNSAPELPIDTFNPYAASGLYASSDQLGSQLSPAQTMEVNTQLQRAFRAAVMGLVLVPLAMNLYSVYLLVRLPSQTWTSVHGKRIYMTLFINVMSVAVWMVVIAMYGP